MALPSFIKKIFGGKSGPQEDRSQLLREDFQTRYHHFKLLLTSNNSTLDAMARIQKALGGQEPFSMAFVRSSCTEAGARVYQIVRHLNELSPAGRYKNLFPRFHEIQERIDRCLAVSHAFAEGPLLLSLGDIDVGYVGQTGAKMATLGEAKNKLGMRVPDGFVLTAMAYQVFMRHNELQKEIDRRIQSAEVEGSMEKLFNLSASLQQCIINAPLPDELLEAIENGCTMLRERGHVPLRLAMRSSALGEDAQGASFAGQYRSQLNVSPESAPQAYKEIVAGKYTLQAMAYRLHKGIRDEDIAMCVGVLPLVRSRASGVAYSRDPMRPEEDAVLVNAVWGLPKGVVEGSAPVDALRLSRTPPHNVLKRTVPHKKWRYICRQGEGLAREDLDEEMASDASVSEAEAAKVARLALRLEQHFGMPQDVEWLITLDDELILLQCRPLAQSARKEGEEAEKKSCTIVRSGRALLSGGVPVCSGIAAGEAHPVLREADALTFAPGGVMVVAQSLPRWAAMVPSAAALVAEQGSVTGHLANVAREFGVPAVMGLEGAVEALRDKGLVTVDGDRGGVYLGLRQDLVDARESVAAPMLGTPVYETLRDASQHILPLTLLDPDAPDFRPRNCKSLHDITRYCHEKAVIEMFQFGYRHQFPERSSRQLYTKAPMQFWIMDLDDGIDPSLRPEQAHHQYVYLDEIVSMPMQALWRGISAKAWAGPPPVDAKGFMSILVEATCNPALDPALPTQYTARNYFMIAKHFCSLQSRFGFHFSSVEALVGERKRENYITFRFKGGAASLDRRIGRARLLDEILSDYGFQNQLMEDALAARAEGLPQERMAALLTIVGYLTIHTRQLDMVMGKSESYRSISQNLRKEIAEVMEQTDSTI